MIRQPRDRAETAVARALEESGTDRSALIGALQTVNRECNYLPEPALRSLSQRLGVPLSEVYHVATFYTAFSLEPRGKHIVKICIRVVRSSCRLHSHSFIAASGDDDSNSQGFSLGHRGDQTYQSCNPTGRYSRHKKPSTPHPLSSTPTTPLPAGSSSRGTRPVPIPMPWGAHLNLVASRAAGWSIPRAPGVRPSRENRCVAEPQFPQLPQIWSRL